MPRSTNSVTWEANRVQSVYSLTAESKQAPQYKTQILHLQSVAETGNTKITMTQEQARKLFYDMVLEIEGIREKTDYGVISIKASAPGSTDYIAVKLKQHKANKNMRSFYNKTLRPLRFGYHVYSKWPATQ